MDGVGLASWHSSSVCPVIVESFSISLLSGSDDEEYNLQNKFLIVGQRERGSGEGKFNYGLCWYV